MSAKRKTTYRRISYRERKPAKGKKAFPFKTVLVLVIIGVLTVLAVTYFDFGEVYKSLLEGRPERDLRGQATPCINEVLAYYGAKPERLEFKSSVEQSPFGKKRPPRATAEIPSAYSLLFVLRSLDSSLTAEGFSIGEAVLSEDKRRLEIKVQSPENEPLLGLTLISSPLLSPQPSKLAVVITALESAPDRVKRDFLRLDFPINVLLDFQDRETLGLLSLAKDAGKEVILSLALDENKFRTSARWYDFGRGGLKFEDVVGQMLERFSFIKGLTFEVDSVGETEMGNLQNVANVISRPDGYLFALSPRLYEEMRELDRTAGITVLGGQNLLDTHQRLSGSLRHKLLVLGDVMVYRRHGIVVLEANSETLSTLKTVVSDYRERNLNLVFLSELG